MRYTLTLAAAALLTACTSSPTDETTQTTSAPDSATWARVPDSHTSRNSLDWTGFYAGNLPCADCEGIKTTIRLNANNTYTGTSEYLGKNATPFPSNGVFEWTEDGNHVILSGNAGGNRTYQVVEGGLILVNNQGKELKGTDAHRYILAKANAGTKIENRRWVLSTFKGKPLATDAKKQAPYFMMNSLEKRISGTFGCNRFFGTYVLSPGDSLQLSKLGVTMMACPDMELEDALQAVFPHAEHYRLKGDSLLILDAPGKESFAEFRWKD